MTLDEITKEDDVVVEADGFKFLINKNQQSLFEDNALDFLESYFGMGDFLLKPLNNE
ncbi:MAG TPA: hypothetical protein VK125_07095 [Bacillota bacterium]|nr:hypothetical protein [Bacillota bacterium]